MFDKKSSVVTHTICICSTNLIIWISASSGNWWGPSSEVVNRPELIRVIEKLWYLFVKTFHSLFHFLPALLTVSFIINTVFPYVVIICANSLSFGSNWRFALRLQMKRRHQAGCLFTSLTTHEKIKWDKQRRGQRSLSSLHCHNINSWNPRALE